MSVEGALSTGGGQAGKVLLFVHGAGKTDPDYALAPLAAITQLLGVEPPYVSVYYADVIKLGPRVGATSVSGSGQRTGAAESHRVAQFKEAFTAQVQTQLNAPPAGDRPVSAATLPGQDIAERIATEVNEIAGYLFDSNVYNHIQSRLYDGLNKAAQLGDSIVVASHSLGSIVAFDGLRTLGARFPVSSLITLGSPLAKLRRLGNRSADLGAITYAHIAEWLNFYDTTDPIADTLGPSFPKKGYRLRDVFVDISTSPIPAHDYFPNPEVLAEIARTLR